MLLVCVGISGSTAVAAMEPTTIDVSGKGEQPVAMDRALITVVVSESGADVSQLEVVVAKTVAKLLDLTDSLAVDRKHVDTTGIRIMPRSRFDPVTKQRIDDGYSVERTVRIDLHKLGSLGRLMREVSRLGISRINQPQLYASTESEAYQAAIAKAVQQATTSANTIARALGGRISRVMHVSEGSSHRPPVVAMTRMAAVSEADSGAFNAAEGTVTASVTMTFEMLQD
jgi:hypothetical protein